MEIVHDKVANFDHIVVQFVIVAQQLVALQLPPSHLKQFLEQLSEPGEVQIVLLEKLIANGRSSQFHDEIIYSLDVILDLSRVVTLHLVRLHLLPVGLLELGGELFVLLLRDEILAHFVLRVEVELPLDLGRAPVDQLRGAAPPLRLLARRLPAVLAPASTRRRRALHATPARPTAAATAAALLELDDLMQVLVLEQERQSQVASHVALGLFGAFLGEPALILESRPLLVLELLVLLEEARVDAILALLAQLEVVARLVLVNVDVQVGLLDEARPCLGRLQVQHERVLCDSELDSITQRFLFRFQGYHICHQRILQEIHVSLLILRELLDESLEGLARFRLGRSGAAPEKLGDTIL